jgi:hypothetical protein
LVHIDRPVETVSATAPRADEDTKHKRAAIRSLPASPDSVAVPAWALVIASYAIIAILQWLPFGWNIGPRVDGWTLLGDVDKGMRPYIFTSPDLVTRPFFFWVWILNHHIDPDDFVLLNIILMVMLIIRGTAMYILALQLFPRQHLFAYLSGALIMIFPADSATYYEGATHVLLSFTLLLVAVNVLVWYWRDRRWWQLVLALCFEAISVGNYEIGNLLLLATPLVLLWLDRHVSWRLVAVTLLWWVIPTASLVVAYADVYFNPASHHNTLLDTTGVPYTQKVWNAIQAQFWTPYAAGFRELLTANTSTTSWSALVALGITCVVALLVLVLRRQNTPTSSGTLAVASLIQWVLLAAASIFAMLLGIILFMPSDQLNSFASYQPARLFYFSAIGAVGTTVALAFALDIGVLQIFRKINASETISRIANYLRPFTRSLGQLKVDRIVRAGQPSRYTIASIVTLAIIASGAMSLLMQHQLWRDYSWKQQRLLGQIILQTGHIEDGTLVFVIDQSKGALDDYLPFNYIFEGAFQLVEDNYSLHARLCYNNAADTGDTRYCRLTPGGIEVPDIWPGGQGFNAPYNHVIGFVLTASGTLNLLTSIPAEFGAAPNYAPGALFNAAAGPPPRYFTMLTYPR